MGRLVAYQRPHQELAIVIHDAAADGYERRSATYAGVRPAYHPAVLDELVDRLGTDGWVDVGAGTGIATAALVERAVDVVAVEPVEAMRARLGQDLPAVDARAGTAEAIPVGDGEAGVVMVAQAFHWFDHRPALDEIARVLRPAGALVTLWNVRDESVPWMAEWTRIVDRWAGETPRYRTMIWRRAIEADPRFELVDEVRVPNPQAADADRVVQRALSTSFIAALAAHEQADVEREMRSLVAPLGDEFDFPYDTEAQIWRTTKRQQ